MNVAELIDELKKHDPEMVVVAEGYEELFNITQATVIETRDFGNGEYDYPVKYAIFPEMAITHVVALR